MNRILAMDLSLACPAFAVLEIRQGEVSVVHLSHVKTSPKKSTGYRLFQIAEHLQGILDTYKFDLLVMEKGFNKFALATQQIQRTVGVVLVTLMRNGYENIGELSPTSVKKCITGSGKASKQELADALVNYLGHMDYKTDDESDSVGVGLAYAKEKGLI
ncbi:crossover junction endodeoxyribonuclease RuvC [Bacillus cereus group sp. MYBK215-1]|uniref:crossover junction endodeoxyribonuclease RuvC n=2 Tax=unclassified Bacillus cereus group TaxID=2750818 RepID=UPI003F79BD86